jgi:hypothetical protein
MRQHRHEEVHVTAPGRVTKSGALEAAAYQTRFASLDDFVKGGVELINDDARHYAFSNVFDVAGRSAPYEQVAVGKNMEYVLECLRAEGTSGWRIAAHDQFALCMDGEVEIELVKAGADQAPAADIEGSVGLDDGPSGPKMGRIVVRRGHQALLPAGGAYRFNARTRGVLIIQTIAGRDTKFRWNEICQTV